MKIVKLASLIIILGVFAACTPPPTMLPTATSTITNTITPSLTPVFTWTPLPTLSDANAEAQLLEWLEGTPDCQFPCWAGITLQQTTWSDAIYTLEEVVDIVSVYEDVDCTFGPCSFLEWYSRDGLEINGSIYYSYADSSIYRIIVNVDTKSLYYELDQVLTQYGAPEKVFLFTNTVLLPSGDIPLELTLVYPIHQFIIKYIWIAKRVGENVVGCTQAGASIKLSIQPVTEGWSDDYIKFAIYGNGDLSSVNLQPLEQVTEMTTGKFYETFISVENDDCIITPVNYWDG